MAAAALLWASGEANLGENAVKVPWRRTFGTPCSQMTSVLGQSVD